MTILPQVIDIYHGSILYDLYRQQFAKEKVTEWDIRIGKIDGLSSYAVQLFAMGFMHWSYMDIDIRGTS